MLSPEEVALLLHCASSLKHKAALSVAYGCGLRVSKIVHLKMIRVEQGKGRKDRYVALSHDLLELLRRRRRSVISKGTGRPVFCWMTVERVRSTPPGATR